MTDPLGIDVILENITAIVDADRNIGTIKEVPTVFSEVANGAKIVEETLRTARSKLNNLTVGSYMKVHPLVQQCINDSAKLKNIYRKLENESRQNSNQKSWNEARIWYLEALEHEKENRVECLLKSILERLKEICSHDGVNLLASIEAIDATLKKIDEAGASLADSAFNTGASVKNNQNIYGGYGQQSNCIGGINTFNSGYNISGGSVSFGQPTYGNGIKDIG